MQRNPHRYQIATGYRTFYSLSLIYQPITKKRLFFLEKEDIFSKPVSMQEIMRNQVLNTHKFGKLFVSSNGDVRAGSVLEAPIGNLHAENIRRLVHKEMTEGKSWLHIRNQKPCCDCIYQWLCPSPSDYESVIGRPNLCHIEE